MYLIPFVSFIICTALNAFTEIQSIAIAAILFAVLLQAAFKSEVKISAEMLPYIAMPIILFASINEKLQDSSNNMILCFSMLAITLLIFLENEIYNKQIFRSMLICGNCHLLMQIFGVSIGHYSISTSSIFPLANEIAFFYMLVVFSAGFVYRKDNAYWKIYAAAIGSLALISIAAGETIYTKWFVLGSEDAVGIWIGLFCGALFAAFLFLWKKFNLPKIPAIGFSTLVFLAWMFSSIIVLNSSFFSAESMREATSRLDNWQAAWNIAKENPLGVGFGAYGANSMQHWPLLSESYTSHKLLFYTSAHCQYLQILTEIGWPGFFYYCALFALPFFLAVFRYLKTGEIRFLLIAWMLATVLSVMEVAEAMSMFAFIQIIHWAFLIYCVKALLPLRAAPRCFEVRASARILFFALLTPLLFFLLMDRGKQLYSKSLIAPIEIGLVTEDKAALLDSARSIYPKNAGALWHTGYLHFKAKEYEEALKAMDAIEELEGYLWPINHVRAEVYYEMGDLEKACEAAKFPIAHFDDSWILSIKEKLECFPTQKSKEPD